ncbi:hypothetical protein PtB15_13B242 [Puccinia triticina]|nr:hypothetical protein PtB15_13B242 [Puccinia triticina]
MATIPFPARFFAIFNSYRGPASLLGNLWRLIKSPAKSSGLQLPQHILTPPTHRDPHKGHPNYVRPAARANDQTPVQESPEAPFELA